MAAPGGTARMPGRSAFVVLLLLLSGIVSAAAMCGDGTVDGGTGETCDDGNMDDGDGCSYACTVEDGWSCTGLPSACSMQPGGTACATTEDCLALPGCSGEYVGCAGGTCYKGNFDSACASVSGGERYEGQVEGHWCWEGRSDTRCSATQGNGTLTVGEGSGSASGSGVSTGMRCYDSAGDATQCQDGAHSCVTFVELTQSNVSGNVSAGPFLNKDTRKCGTSRVFPQNTRTDNWDPALFTTEDSPMCDPDLCEVVVEASLEGEDWSSSAYVRVIPFGPHPSRETEHKDSRTVDPIWQYFNENLDGEGGIGSVYLEVGGGWGDPHIPKCVPKNTATCFNNFKAAFVANPGGRPEPVCEATPGCTWDAMPMGPYAPVYRGDFQYLEAILGSLDDSLGSCQASNPREYGTDKVKLANPTSMCADKTLAEDTGIVCDGPGVKVTSTGSTVYECCRGDLCNKDTKQALVNLQTKLQEALPSEAYCATTGVHCAQPFAKTYQCMLTSMPNLRLEDECFGALVPKFGCLSEMCMKGMAGTEDPEKLDYAASGCGLDKIADRMCDPLCMTPMTAMDGGDCLVVATAMKRKFMAADLNSDGMVDSNELKETKLLDNKARLEDFDIVATDGKAGLDAYEFALLLSQHDELVQDQLHRESGAGMRWSRAVALGAATHIMLLGDENMDGKLSMEEALASYGCNGQDFDMMLRLGGRFMPLDAELYESDKDLEDEKQRQETQVKELLVPDIGKVMYGVMAALVGDKWADSEYRKGFSVAEAVRLAVKFADYNNDGLVSRAESALLSMPPALFSALSPEGADGKQLSLDDILTALEDVSACDDVLVVDRPGEISLKTLYMPRGKCSLLIMPGWNLPASYAVSEGPTCPDKGSASGSGAGKRRLLALGDSSTTKTAQKSPRASSSPRYPAASRASRGARRGGDKQPKGKFATRNLLRSVVARHHKHPLVSTALLGSDLNAKASKAKKHHHHHVEKRARTAKAEESRRNQQLQQALKQLRSKRPAARARALGPSRRGDMEQALAKSLEQSALRVGKRGGRGRLGKQGMRAYRRAVKTNSGRAARVWQSLKGAVRSMRARMQRSLEQGKGKQQQRGRGRRLRRQDVRKTTKTKALRSRALAKARMMVKNKFKSPFAVRRLAAKAGDAVKRQAADGRGERKLLEYETSAVSGTPSPSDPSADDKTPSDLVPVCTRWLKNSLNTEGEEFAGESAEGREGCLKMVMEKCPDAPLITFKPMHTAQLPGCYCQYGTSEGYVDREDDMGEWSICAIEDVEYRLASGAHPPPTASDLTGEEYVELFGRFPEMLEETAASIEKALKMHNEYLEKLDQAPVSAKAFMDLMVEVGMPRELADMLLAHPSSRDTGMEETASDFGFVARVFNGCTLRGLAMNYSHEEWECVDDPHGHVAADQFNDCSQVDAQGGGWECDNLDPDFNGVQNVYVWELCPKSCNRCPSGSKDGAQAPYCGLPWTVGQRVVQEMDSDGDGVISPHETCISPADFAKAAGFGQRVIGAYGETDGLSREVPADPAGSGVSVASECPTLPVFKDPNYENEGQSCSSNDQCGAGLWCGSQCSSASHSTCDETKWKRAWAGDVCQLQSKQPCIVDVSSEHKCPPDNWMEETSELCHSNPACEVTLVPHYNEFGAPAHSCGVGISWCAFTMEDLGMEWDTFSRLPRELPDFTPSVQPDEGDGSVFVSNNGYTAQCQPKGWARCQTNFQRTGACEDTRGCRMADPECVPAPVEPAEEKGKTMGFGGSITPHDINRLVQYTLYARHFDGNYSADDQSGRHMDITENYRKDGFVNFTEYESFMEAMLVLFGDDTSPPDIDKIFEAYGVASEDPTRPGKVITIQSVPISEYWFKMIFLGEQRLFDSLYEYDHDPPYQSKPVEFDKPEVLESAGYLGQQSWSWGNGEGATLNDTVKSLFVDCGAPASAQGSGAPASARGSGSGSGSSSEASSCYDLPLFRDAEGEGCDFYAANADAYCARSGEVGTLAFMNKEGMDASRACCACGGGTPEDPTPTLYDSDGGYTCSGTLIHPRWVLTSARCASTAKRVEVAGSEGCPEEHDLARALMHPGYEYGGDYDVGLIELATPSSVTPVQMYEGGDLGYSDCHALQYIAALADEGKALVMQLGAVTNEECDAELEAREGFQRVTRNMLCAVPPDTFKGHMLPGAPLLVPWKGANTGLVQIGVHKSGGAKLYTRVSEMLQWILLSKGVGKHPAQMLNLHITDLGLPHEASVTIYAGHSESARAKWTIDSSCDAGDSYIDQGHGAMLVVVQGPAFEQITFSAKLDIMGCAASQDAMNDKDKTSNGQYSDEGVFGAEEDFPLYIDEMSHCMAGCTLADCQDDLWHDSLGRSCADYAENGWCIDGEAHPELAFPGVRSSPELDGQDMKNAQKSCCACGGGKGHCGDAKCELSLAWPNITSMGKIGKSFSGGLGHKAERTSKGHYGVWACVRDWIPEEMIKCGVGPGQLACFRFDEISREFHFYGSNDKMKLVSEEAIRGGFIKEENVLAMLPRAHHDPAPFLA